MYLQSETGRHFSLKMDNVSYHSTTSGYLIMSQLKDSIYDFSIIFPGDQWSEHKFTVPIKGKDHGYLIKNFGEKGWGLYDLQTSAVQMAKADPSKAGLKAEPRQVSKFTMILSKASDDPSLLEALPQLAVVREEEKPVEIKATPPEEKVEEKEKEKEKEVIAKTDPPKTEIKEETKTETPVQIPPKSETETNKEILVSGQEVLPQAKAPMKEEQKKEEKPLEKQAEKPEEKMEIASPPVTKLEEKKTDPPVVTELQRTEEKQVSEYKRSVVTRRAESSTTEGFGLTFTDESEGRIDTIRIIIPNPKYTLISQVAEKKEEKKFLEIDEKKEEKIVVKKNKCSSIASENDFLKLRKKMAAEKGDEDMISEARKAFRSKCYTVEQLRNLGSLFLDDGGKYKFYDESYTHVSDLENFAGLEKELKDEYYLKRFRAMIE